MARSEYFRRLELVIQNTTNMVVVTNMHREIEWVNPAYTEVTGWTLDEVKGKNPRSILHGPRTDLKAASRLGGFLRKGLAVKDFEMLNYKKSGEPYWVSLDIQPILDDEGQVAEYIAIQSDITDRKRRELEIARMLRRLDEAQRIAKIGSMEHDLATGQVHCSQEIYRILDADESEIDTSYESLMACAHPEDAATVRLRYEEAVNSGSDYESEHRVISRTGRVKWVHMRGVLEGWDDGTPPLCRMAVQDITERKAAEQTIRDKALLEQSARTQTEILSRVSHELRTPLHAVLGFAEMVERSEVSRLSERSKGYMRHISQSARHLLLIVNDILDLTRLQGGRVVFYMAPVDLGAVVKEIATMLEPVAAGRRVAVVIDAPGKSLLAHADRHRLGQVLINLVGNAIKYNRGDGRVDIQVKQVGERQVAIAVRDTGIGIAPQHLERLFEPFYRVADSRSDIADDEGSGLGLAIAKSLTEGMGGNLLVESEVATGSTFVVTLPAAIGVETTSSHRNFPEEHATVDALGSASGSVLYIEDNEVNCRLIEGILAARPEVSIVCCATGADGLKVARGLRPTIILIDMHLPDMSGHDVMRSILEEPDLYRTPCIAFSADNDDKDVEAAIRSGFREYLHKPVSAEEFLRMIDRLMSEEISVTRL